MQLFQIQNNQPVITSEALLIPEFSAIWQKDKTKKKEQATKELSYIYFMADYKSVYQAYSEDVMEKQIIKDVFGKKKWKASKDVERAVEKYKELQQTPSMRLLKSFKDAINSLEKYFKNINFEERDTRGNPIYKVSDVTNALQKAGAIIESLDKVENKVKKEMHSENIARGQKDINPFEE